jgi:hypothetical protein
MKGMNLTKAQVARRQLGTALALFLDDRDPVSVHALACAGGEIAEHLTHKAGVRPFSSHALATFPDLDTKKLRRLRNQFWNAFKHATTRKDVERDDRKLLKRFNDLQNDHTLFIGWYDYAMTAKPLPLEAQVFQIWYFALHPEKLNRDVDQTPYAETFPRLPTLSRKKQKQALRDVIARYRKNSDAMNDAKTERAPLMA